MCRRHVSGFASDTVLRGLRKRGPPAGHDDNEVVEELQKGYKLKERLLRPAIVKVAVAGHHSAGQTRSDSRARSKEGTRTEAGED